MGPIDSSKWFDRSGQEVLTRSGCDTRQQGFDFRTVPMIILRQILPELEITAATVQRPREDDFSDCIECLTSAEKNPDDVQATGRAALIRVLNSFECPEELKQTAGKRLEQFQFRCGGAWVTGVRKLQLNS